MEKKTTEDFSLRYGSAKTADIAAINADFLKQNGYIAKNGIELTELSEGYAKGRMKLDDSSNNPYGYVHGGCIFTLADTVGGSAALTFGGAVTTLSAEIHYLNPAKSTEYLEAQASVIKNGKKTAVLETKITDAEGENIAMVTLTFFKL